MRFSSFTPALLLLLGVVAVQATPSGHLVRRAAADYTGLSCAASPIVCQAKDKAGKEVTLECSKSFDGKALTEVSTLVNKVNSPYVIKIDSVDATEKLGNPETKACFVTQKWPELKAADFFAQAKDADVVRNAVTRILLGLKALQEAGIVVSPDPELIYISKDGKNVKWARVTRATKAVTAGLATIVAKELADAIKKAPVGKDKDKLEAFSKALYPGTKGVNLGKVLDDAWFQAGAKAVDLEDNAEAQKAKKMEENKKKFEDNLNKVKKEDPNAKPSWLSPGN